MARQLQLAVTRLERWSRENGLRFSTAKTVAVHFCRRRCSDPDLGIRLNGETIPTQPVARFLGVMLDRRLRYEDHFRTLRDRCFKSLNVLKCVARTSYGADRRTLLLLYRSMIRSKLDYASFVYDSAGKASKTTLDTVHHAALRVATGAFRTSPKASLLAEAHELPLSLRRQLLGMRYALKLRQFPAHPTYPYVFSRGTLALFDDRGQSSSPFCTRMRDLFDGCGLLLRDVRRISVASSPPWERARPLIDLSLADTKKEDIHPTEARSKAMQLIASYEGRTALFTDGSKTSDGVGCAFVSSRDTRSFSLPACTSVFSSELVAIEKALCFIEVSTEALHLILTDSMSSLLALRSFNPSDPLVQDVLTRLTSIERDGKAVQFCWIPSHVGVTGNELADAAARRAASAPHTRRLPLPARDFYPAVKAFVHCQWQQHWDGQCSNKLKEIKSDLKPWRSSLRRNRREEVTLCRLRIGHTYATHGYLLRGEDAPTCLRCREPLTVAHTLLSCPCFGESRARHLGRAVLEDPLRCVLGDESDFVLSGSLFSFIQDIQFPVIYSHQ